MTAESPYSQVFMSLARGDGYGHFADKKTKILFVCGNLISGIKNSTSKNFLKFF